MSSLRFLTAPITALFDLKLYREAVRLPAGKGVLYCAYLSAIFCIVVSIIGTTVVPKVDDFMRWLKGEWPPVTLTVDGLKLDEGQNPKALVHPQYGPIAMFDDTKTTITEEEMGSYFAYFTSTMLYTRSQNGFQSRPLPTRPTGEDAKEPRIDKIRFEGEAIEKAYFQFKPLVMTVFVIAVLAFGFIIRLIGALLLGLIGFIVQIFIPRKLSFENLFVLGSFALTIGLWFALLQMVPGIARFFPPFLAQILTLIYFCIAIAVQDKPAAASN